MRKPFKQFVWRSGALLVQLPVVDHEGRLQAGLGTDNNRAKPQRIAIHMESMKVFVSEVSDSIRIRRLMEPHGWDENNATNCTEERKDEEDVRMHTWRSDGEGSYSSVVTPAFHIRFPGAVIQPPFNQ